MSEAKWKEELAFKWCEDYGDKVHHNEHHSSPLHAAKFSMWCGNCRDGLNYIKDVVREIKDKF